jgi:hypothetical protein
MTMYLDNYEHDYTEMDRETAEKRAWLVDALPWVTDLELENLRTGFDFPNIPFPGPWAEYSELGDFVERFKRGRSRLVACRMQTQSFTVSAQLDLVSGTVYIADNGRYTPTHLSGFMTFEFDRKSEARRMSSMVDFGTATLISSQSMRHLVRSLEKAGSLPAL